MNIITEPKKKKNYILNEEKKFNQDSPSVAKFTNNDFIVTWNSQNQDGSGKGIFAKIIDQFGIIKKPEFQINNYSNFDQFNPSVKTFLNGNFIISWTSFISNGSGTDIYAQLFNFQGNKMGDEFRVNNFTRFTQENSKIATFFDGRFIITWQSQSQDKSGKAVIAQYFKSNGEKLGSEFLVNSYTRFDQEKPTICSFTSGEAIIAWHSQAQDKSGKGIYAQKLSINSEKIGKEILVNNNTKFDQQNPSIGCFSDGRALIAWESDKQDSSGKGIFAQMFSSNLTKIGSEFLVNTLTKNNQVNPKISVYLDNKFIISWTSSIDTSQEANLYAQLYNEFAQKIGSQLLVNSKKFYDISGSDLIVTFNNEDFLTVWTGFDGSGSGVVAQNYEALFKPNISDYEASSSFYDFFVSNIQNYNQTKSLVIADEFSTTFIWESKNPVNTDCTGVSYETNEYLSNIPKSTIFIKKINFSNNKSTKVERINNYNDVEFEPSISKNNNITLITWTSSERDGSGTGIYAKLINVSNDNIQEFKVNDYNFADQFESHSSFLVNDKFVVVWASECYDGSGSGIFGKIYNTKIEKQKVDIAMADFLKLNENSCNSILHHEYEFPINTWTNNNQFEPKVTATLNGFAVVWTSQEQDGNGLGVYFQEFTIDGIKFGQEILVNNYTLNDQFHPNIASFSNGYIIISWTSSNQDGYGKEVYAKIFDSNRTSIGDDFRINSHVLGDQDNAQIAIFDNSSCILTWASDKQDSSGYGISAQRIDFTGKKIGPEIKVNDKIINNQVLPSIAVLPNKTFIITWTDTNEFESIVAKRFVIDDEFYI